MVDQTTDLLGKELTAEKKLPLDLHAKLEAMSAQDDLAPCTQMNLRQAMVMLWNACTDLGLIFEEPGVD